MDSVHQSQSTHCPLLDQILNLMESEPSIDIGENCWPSSAFLSWTHEAAPKSVSKRITEQRKEKKKRRRNVWRRAQKQKTVTSKKCLVEEKDFLAEKNNRNRTTGEKRDWRCLLCWTSWSTKKEKDWVQYLKCNNWCHNALEAIQIILFVIIVKQMTFQRFFLKDFTPRKPTGHQKGKRLLKWESKVKSRAGRTTTQAQYGKLYNVVHVDMFSKFSSTQIFFDMRYDNEE